MLLTIKDKEYGLKFGQLAFEPLEDELEKGGADIITLILFEQSKGIVKTYAKLIYEAIKLWCRTKEQDIEISYIEFRDWYDALPNSSKEAKFIQSEFEGSFVQGVSVEKWIELILDHAQQMAAQQAAANNSPTQPESEVKPKKDNPKRGGTRAQKSLKTVQDGESTDKPTKS